jgi:hypothetical protein
MKNLNLLALALLCSVGSSAVAKGMKSGDMISLTNNNSMKYERAVVEVSFLPASHAFRVHTGYVELAPVTKSANLLSATERPCKYQEVKKDHYKSVDGSCGGSILARHFNNDASNVRAITVRKIQAGKFSDYYRFQPGTPNMDRPRGAFAHQRNGMKGTEARSFVINGKNITEKN